MGSAPVPATIVGLLRRGTVVFVHGVSGVVLGPDTRPADARYGEWSVAPVEEWPYTVSPIECAGLAVSCRSSEITVDTEDLTSRAHVAWWILDRAASPYFARMNDDERKAAMDAVERACAGRPMNDRHINLLVNVALRIAGLETA